MAAHKCLRTSPAELDRRCIRLPTDQSGKVPGDEASAPDCPRQSGHAIAKGYAILEHRPLPSRYGKRPFLHIQSMAGGAVALLCYNTL